MKIEGINKIDFSIKSLKKFGITFSIIFFIISIILFIKSTEKVSFYFFAASILLLLITLLQTDYLKPFYKVWMTFSILFGFITTNIILTIVFYFIVTPVGLILKIAGKDLLDIKIDKEKNSYWNFRTECDYKKEYSEKQY